MPSASDNVLSITHRINAPRATVWRCWTEAALLKQWYCPKPWRVTQAELDLRPGGRMNAVFKGPDGDIHDNKGIFLAIASLEKLIFTDAYSEDFIPKKGMPFMTGFVHLSDHPDGGASMHWGARHWSAEDMAKHEAMGFHEGWKACAAQLDELAQKIAAGPGTAS